ncbi:MAG: CPBP family intramembrane metalloprotease [Lachnospiraceae bacterium]|nr:CPBP family intramembrane metalloprotease [Lachnospiraceae bacterium]
MESKKEDRITDTLNVTLRFFIAFVVYWSASAVFGILTEHAVFAFPSKDKLYISFIAGILEELIFRLLIISVLLRKRREKKQLYRALMISTVIFALAHGGNIFYGAGIGVSIMQMISAMAMGTAFGLLFLRTRHILPGMILHTLHDIIALSEVGATDESGLVIHGITLASVVDLLLVIAMGVYLAFFYSRKSETEKMLVIWRKKNTAVK